MEPQRTSVVVPVIVTLIISAIIFGSIGYYVAAMNAPEAATPTAQPTTTAQATSTATTTTTTPTVKPTATATTTADETATWTTYTNTTHGFSFKYPTTWKVTDITSGVSHMKEYVGFFGATPKTMTSDNLYLVGILSTTLTETVDAQKASIAANTNAELVSVTDVQKFGLTGKKISQKNKSTGVVSSIYYLEKNGRTYSIPADSTTTNADEKTAYKITDTFTFTK